MPENCTDTTGDGPRQDASRCLGRLRDELRRLLSDPTTILGMVLIVAYLTRLYGSQLVYTSDEAYWMQRTLRFGAALARGDLEMTYRSGHPGVTIMWVGLAGIGPTRLPRYLPQRFTSFSTLERDARFLETFAAARYAMLLAAASMTTVVIALAWRLLGRGAGLLGGTLLLLDPYVVGMTRLLHVDALLALLMAVSALAGLLWWRERRRAYLLLSAATGGLALLTKAPAAYLPIFLAALVLITSRDRHILRHRLGSLVIWACIAGLVYVALWPAMWVDPASVVRQVVEFVVRQGGQPHNWSNYFLGSPVTEDPGLLFYPVTLAYRLGPLVIVALLIAAAGLWGRTGNVVAVALAGYAFGFMVLMTLGGKKFDRYMLPAMVILDLLAGVGLWLAVQWIRRTWAKRGIVALAVAVQFGLLVSAYPYLLAAYNPLLGGVAGAQRVMLVGWGEGLEQVAAYLNRQPNADRLVASTLYHHALRPLFRGKTQRIVEPLSPDYFVVYVNMAQRELVPADIEQLIGERAPEFTATVHGVEYAWVYRLPAGMPVLGPEQELETAPEDEQPEGEHD